MSLAISRQKLLGGFMKAEAKTKTKTKRGGFLWQDKCKVHLDGKIDICGRLRTVFLSHGVTGQASEEIKKRKLRACPYCDIGFPFVYTKKQLLLPGTTLCMLFLLLAVGCGNPIKPPGEVCGAYISWVSRRKIYQGVNYFTLDIPDTGTVTTLEEVVVSSLFFPSAADLTIYVISPRGERATLLDRDYPDCFFNGGAFTFVNEGYPGADKLLTVYFDTPSPLAAEYPTHPKDSYSSFIGTPLQGSWQLVVVNHLSSPDVPAPGMDCSIGSWWLKVLSTREETV